MTEIDKFVQWREKKTEFARDWFLAFVSSIMEGYDCGVPKVTEDSITWTCETRELETSHMTEEGRFETRSVRLKIVVKAEWREDYCSVSHQCSGHGESFGASTPYKTREETGEESLRYSLGTKYLRERTFPRYEQIRLF